MTGNAESVDEILIVDDSPTVIAAASKMLQDRYTVHTASNGEEAWDMLQNNMSISMVFSDMQMPVMNGLELLLKIRKSKDSRLATMPVVMVTGKTDTPAGKQAVFDIGATDFIGKPFNALDLLTRTRAHIDGKLINRKRRMSDVVQTEHEILASPSAFHSVGCQALEYALENKTDFTVVYIELANYSEIEELVGENNAKAIILTVAKRLNETIREEDVATRLGINKLAVIYNLVGTSSQVVVDRLIEYMDNLAFEHENQPLDIDIRYGYENSKKYGKNSTFTEICMCADANLQVQSGDMPGDKGAKRKASEPSESIFEGFRSRGKKIGLWFALKHIINGDYESIPDQHKHDLVSRMKKYLEYIEGKA